MPLDRSFLEHNQAESAHLRQLAARLSDADLKRSLGGGWTVAIALAHLAFWDRRVLVVLDRWEREGKVGESLIDSDAVNEAALPLWAALPPREALQLALSCGDEVDQRLSSAAPELLDQIAEKTPVNLIRATHRAEHLEQIERVLKG